MLYISLTPLLPKIRADEFSRKTLVLPQFIVSSGELNISMRHLDILDDILGTMSDEIQDIVEYFNKFEWDSTSLDHLNDIEMCDLLLFNSDGGYASGGV